jgi:single-strand DNA-binding protein
MDNSSTTIVGNLTRDPEFDTLASGASKATFSVASERRWMKDNEWQSEVSYFNFIAWRQQADLVRKLLKKGMGVVVLASAKQRSYEDKEGNNRSVVEFTANSIGLSLWGLESVERRVSSGASTQAKTPDAPDEAPF